MNKTGTKKTAQDIQDEIFRNMSAEKKLELGAQLWKLAMLFSKNKHETKRPASTFGRAR